VQTGSAATDPAPFDGLGAKTVVCADATYGAGVVTDGAVGVGPFHMPGPDERGSHWSDRAKRFSGKLPVVVTGQRTVTVQVPDRLAGRVALTYGHSGLAGEITFVPCPGRTTFFAGGMVFTRREPIALLVQVDGWPAPRPLRLGVIPPN
jgi:hypothetical protein